MGNLKSIAKENFSNGEEYLNTDTLSTMEYTSPETFNNSVYLKESDIFSFAVMAYELLLEKSFSNFEGFAHIDAITNKKYRPSLDDLHDHPELKYIVEQSWQDNWKMRPSFEEICQRLYFLMM